jgi:thiamine-monophosphate kinase
MNEQGILNLIQHQLNTSHFNLLNDDVFYDAKSRQILTKDLLIEGRHFSLDYFQPENVGYKAISVNVSDVASIGGMPQYYLIGLGLPERLAQPEFISGLYDGMKQALSEYGGQIVGGDTVGAEQLTLSITAIANLPEGAHPGQRFSAQPGDWVITTGHSGLSALGLAILQDNTSPDRVFNFPVSLAKHRRPQARLVLGQGLAKQYQRFAMTDSSDGLADAVLKIAQASGVDMELDATAIPLHPELMVHCSHDKDKARQLALYGGEDFELVACVPGEFGSWPSDWTVIGRVKEASPKQSTNQFHDVLLLGDDGQIDRLGFEKTFQHF